MRKQKKKVPHTFLLLKFNQPPRIHNSGRKGIIAEKDKGIKLDVSIAECGMGKGLSVGLGGEGEEGERMAPEFELEIIQPDQEGNKDMAPGAGTVAYLKGELKALEGANIDRVWRATEGVVNELNLTVINKVKDAGYANLIALTADNETIHITLKKRTDNVTEIFIMIGTAVEDQKLSMLILEKIQKRLYPLIQVNP